MDVWASITPTRYEGATTGGSDVMEAAVPRKAAAAVAHPVVAAMNGATVSILLRLKHATMFEDFQVCIVIPRLVSFVLSSMSE